MQFNFVLIMVYAKERLISKGSVERLFSPDVYISLLPLHPSHAYEIYLKKYR